MVQNYNPESLNKQLNKPEFFTFRHFNFGFYSSKTILYPLEFSRNQRAVLVVDNAP